jgi:hypothetical protein
MRNVKRWPPPEKPPPGKPPGKPPGNPLGWKPAWPGPISTSSPRSYAARFSGSDSTCSSRAAASTAKSVRRRSSRASPHRAAAACGLVSKAVRHFTHSFAGVRGAGGGPRTPRPGPGSAPPRPPRSGRPRPPCPGGSAWRPRSRPAPARRARVRRPGGARRPRRARWRRARVTGALRAPGAWGRAAAGVTPGACYRQGRATMTEGVVRAPAADTVRPSKPGLTSHTVPQAFHEPVGKCRQSRMAPPWLQACVEWRLRGAGRGVRLFYVPVGAQLVDLQDGVVVLARGHLGGLLRLPQRLARWLAQSARCTRSRLKGRAPSRADSAGRWGCWTERRGTWRRRHPCQQSTRCPGMRARPGDLMRGPAAGMLPRAAHAAPAAAAPAKGSQLGHGLPSALCSRSQRMRAGAPPAGAGHWWPAAPRAPRAPPGRARPAASAAAPARPRRAPLRPPRPCLLPSAACMLCTLERAARNGLW